MSVALQALALLCVDRRADQSSQLLFQLGLVHVAHIAVGDDGTALEFQRNVHASEGGEQRDDDQCEGDDEKDLRLAAEVADLDVHVVFLSLFFRISLL